MTDPMAAASTASSKHDAVLRGNLEQAQASAAHDAATPQPAMAFNGRWTRRHWAHASLFATMGALVAAIVPGFSTAMHTAPNTQRTTLSLALPQLRLHQGNTDRWQSVTLKSGQTLSAVFSELGIPYDQLEKVMQHPKIKPALRKLRPGTALSFNLPSDGSVRAMRIEAAPGIGDEPVELEFNGDALRERAVPQEALDKLRPETMIITNRLAEISDDVLVGIMSAFGRKAYSTSDSGGIALTLTHDGLEVSREIQLRETA